MRYRPLGRTGLNISEISFGAWGIGGDAAGAVAYGPADRQESIGALRHALKRGVNFFDTADFYGFGHSETLLGEALADAPHAVVASKAGMLDAARQDFSADHLRRSLEGSLRRLRRGALDLFQLHSPPAELLREAGGPLEVLARLRAEGLIRAIGVSARSPDDALIAAARPEVDCLQVNFNLLDQRALESGLFEACAERRIGVIVRTPLCFGFLTGRYAADQDYDAHDHRSKWSVAQREAWASGPMLFEAWRGGGDETAAQFALRYCLSHPAVTCAIPGMLTPAHVAENVAASDLGPLSAATLGAIADTYRRHSFFVREPRKESLS